MKIKKAMRRAIPAALAMSMAAASITAYAGTASGNSGSGGPGAPYSTEVMEKLQDNVMEYDEIEMLIDTYNTSLKNLRESYADSKHSMEDIDRLKDQISDGSEQLLDASSQLANTAETMKPLVGFELSMRSLKDILDKISGNIKDSIQSKDDLIDMKDQIVGGVKDFVNSGGQFSDLSDMFGDLIGDDIPVTTISVTPSAYAELVYNSVLLENQAEQLLLSADQLTEMTPEMMRIQMIDSPRAMLISGAQSLMIAYENICVQKETLLSAIELAEAGLQTTERLAAVGMGTQSDVDSIRQSVSSAKSGLITLEANEVNLRQQLCNMLGWAYDASPEIPAIPSVDLSRIDAMNLETDTKTALENNFTLKYNRLSESTLTSGSVQMENLKRTIKAEEAEIATSMTKLYSAVLQARNEYFNAQATEESEQANLATAERQYALGMLSKMEYMQAQNTYQSAKTNVRVAELNLLQAIETYEWAVKGSLTLSQ